MGNCSGWIISFRGRVGAPRWTSSKRLEKNWMLKVVLVVVGVVVELFEADLLFNGVLIPLEVDDDNSDFGIFGSLLLFVIPLNSLIF